jgi:hypothetical protein
MVTELKLFAPSTLPIDARRPLSRDLLGEVLGHLRLQGRDVMRRKTRAQIIQILAAASKAWCHADYALRRKALEVLPPNTGLSREMVDRGIDLTFSKITAEHLSEYANHELELFHSSATGDLIGHIAPGTLFPPVVQSLFHGLLVQSPNFIRSSEHDLHFPVLLAQSLIDIEPELGDAIAVAHWSSANVSLNKELARTVDTLVVYGSDETLAEWREMLPPQKRFVGFGHRVSIGFISQEGLKDPSTSAAGAAFDTSMYDQRGCLSPHCFYLEKPSLKQWIAFGTKLADELRRLERELPMGESDPGVEFEVGHLRQKYLFLASQNPDRCKVWCSKTSSWTVIYEDKPEFSPSCLGRTVWLRPVDSAEDLARVLQPWNGRLQCLGTDLSNDLIRRHWPPLRELGLTRICSLGTMQTPPITWANGGCSLLKQLTS